MQPDGTLGSFFKSPSRTSYKAFGIKNNKLYAFMWQKDDYGEVGAAWFRTLDLNTMEYEDVDMSEDFENSFIQAGVYVPEENAFYGFGYECWLRFDVATMKATKLAAPAAGTYNPQMTYNIKTRQIVGVISQGEFYTYDKADGKQTLLKATGVTSPYTAGLCYDDKSNHYIWSPNTDRTSELIAFDPETFEAMKVCDVQDLAQLGYLYCDEAKQKDDQAPQAAQFVAANFTDNSLTGTVEYKLPE